MKRTELKRGKPLKPSAPPARKTPVKPVNRARKAKRKAEGEVYGLYHEWMATRPCLLYGKPGHICHRNRAGHHLVSVKRGGKDEANEVTLCDNAHTKSDLSVHKMGPISFEKRWGVSLIKEALRAGIEWHEGRVWHDGAAVA